jgi:hypothetical protein
MKTTMYLAGLYLLLCSGCQKQSPALTTNNTKANAISPAFIEYTIKQGQQYCDQSSIVSVDYRELKFAVKFDSSAIYKTSHSSNQYDINKLYGFSDNNSAHHLYSARFGWRWSDNALRLFAYVYNDGIRTSKELGTIQTDVDNACSIKVENGRYIFSLNNVSDTMPRTSATANGEGYKLYPYFGGDETAPHDIHILIREITSD